LAQNEFGISDMAFLIGTDEAGYGPNYGPLVIAASVWEVPETGIDEPPDLYKLLSACVHDGTRHGTKRTDELTARVAVADSKRLYRPGGDLRLLELGILTALAVAGHRVRSVRELIGVCCPGRTAQLSTLPWYADLDRALPRHADVDGLRQATQGWRTTAEAAGVRFVSLQARMICAAEFNDGVARLDSKGAVLSEATLDLVAELVRDLPEQRIYVICDKHGGRNHYGPLLQPRFDDRLVRVATESRQLSRYEVGTAKRPIRIDFQVGGEANLPSALASMLAKLLRELCMESFNRFWRQHLPDLRPTAGYPMDARRFRAEIAHVVAHLQLDEHLLWRCR
jgi:ribonuclease HII